MKAFVRSKIHGESADGTSEQVVQTEEVDSKYKEQTTSRMASFITKLQEHLFISR